MSGKRQVHAHEHLPKYVYLSKGRYIWRQGRQGKEVVLCPGGTPTGKIWEAYKAASEHHTPGTLAWLVKKYLDSGDHRTKAHRTRLDYENDLAAVLAAPLGNGRTFGDASPHAITPDIVTSYRDTRVASPVRANRELAALSVACAWGLERGLCLSNPVKGVSRFREHERKRYVRDEEYALVLRFAAIYAYLPHAMELAYLGRLRKAEILALRPMHGLPDGLNAGFKSCRPQSVRWSPRLRAAFDGWIATNGGIGASGFDSAWQRVMVRAGSSIERFTFQDLKAKGVSDFDADEIDAAGHRRPDQLLDYDRKTERIAPAR